MAPISGKDIIPKESINTQKVTNTQNLISQPEPPSQKVIMVDEKMRTDVYLLYVGTIASVTPEKLTPRKKMNMKSHEMLPPTVP